MSHFHNPPDAGDKSLDKRIWASLALNLFITLAETLGGLVSGSLALLSDAAHNFGDVVALVLTLGARKIGRRPPTMRHTYGFKRVEVMAATANAITLLCWPLLLSGKPFKGWDIHIRRPRESCWAWPWLPWRRTRGPWFCRAGTTAMT